MIIAYCTFVVDNVVRGTDTYAYTLISAIAKIDDKNVYHIFTNKADKYNKICNKPNFFVHLIKMNENDISTINDVEKKRISADVLWMNTVLFSAIEQYKFNVVHCLGYYGPLVNKSKTNVKIILTAHGLEHIFVPEMFQQHHIIFLKQYLEKAYQQCDHIITPAYYTREKLNEIYKIDLSKITAIHHGISDRYFVSLEQKKTMPETPYLLFVSFLEKRKNLKGTLLAYKKYLEYDKQGCKLVVIGGGYEDYLDLVRENGIEKQVVFKGQVSFDTLLDYYKNAILFIFTSYYEGFGFVLAEAMAAGLPIVCANNSAIPEIVEDAAILVENDSDQIGRASCRDRVCTDV